MLRRNIMYLLVLCLCLGTACTPSATQPRAVETASSNQPLASQPAGALTSAPRTPASPPQRQSREPDVIYVPTPPEVVAEMLRIAKVKTGDVLYDLGSGDGRIPIMAARKYGIRAVGIDIDPKRITEANENAQIADVTDKVHFIQGDLFQADISEATVVTLYLLESLNEKLRPKLLRELQPGTRIVSHAFRMGDWQPEQAKEVNGHMIYFWTVPVKASSRN
jgi:precorrin-6B methylase 2